MASKKSKMKRLSSSDSDSGPEDRNPPKRAKPEPKETKKKPAAGGGAGGGGGAANRGEETMFKLAKMRYASVTEFRGKILINIREYYQDSNGELKPGKKGISLSGEQWEALKGHIDSIDEAIKQF